MWQPEPCQVHQEKRQVVEHIDRGEVVVELNRVEQRGLAVQHHDVAKMQIAVALANETAGAALVQQDVVPVEHKPREIPEPGAPARLHDAGGFRGQSSRIAFDDAAHGLPSALTRAIGGRPMEPRDGLRQPRHQRDRQHPGLRQPIQQTALIETRHFDQPIDRRARATNRQRSVGLAGDGSDAAVEGRRDPPVDADFRLAHFASPAGG